MELKRENMQGMDPTESVDAKLKVSSKPKVGISAHNIDPRPTTEFVRDFQDLCQNLVESVKMSGTASE